MERKLKIAFTYKGQSWNAVSILSRTPEKLAARHKECGWPGTPAELIAEAKKAKAVYDEKNPTVKEAEAPAPETVAEQPEKQDKKKEAGK